jgi:hypothetical protein
LWEPFDPSLACGFGMTIVSGGSNSSIADLRKAGATPNTRFCAAQKADVDL